MGNHYGHFGLDERCKVAELHQAGHSVRQIATALDRSPSSISRELKRNRGSTVGYKPAYAEERARARRWTGSKLDRSAQLRQRVLTHLGHGHSPEQTAGRIARETGIALISHETIYRFIYAQIARHQDYAWRLYLPRAKAKRGFRGRRGGSPANYIQNRVPISQRPEAADNRIAPGHWEADSALFAKYGQAILALHERTSRIILAQRPPNRTASARERRSMARDPELQRSAGAIGLRRVGGQSRSALPMKNVCNPVPWRHQHLVLHFVCELSASPEASPYRKRFRGPQLSLG